MTIGSISAASLSQYVLSSSNAAQMQRALQSLQNSLASGDLNGAQSAFATVQSDLKNAPSLAQANEISAASQSVQLVNALLSSLNSNTASNLSDTTSSVLEKVYGNRGGLNVLA